MTLPASAAGRGHQSRRPTSASARASSGWPAVGRRRVEQQPAALVGITLPRRAQPLIQHGRRAVRHRAQPVPGHLAQRMTARLGLDGGDEPEFGDEALVIRGELAADTGRERVADELSFQQERGPAPPSLALAEPRERAARHQLPGGFGDHVVVGRGAPAGERGEVLLVPADLPDGERVALEQVRYARPVSPAGAGSRPGLSGGSRARCRWSSARRTGTGSPATRSADDRRPGVRTARPGSGTRRSPAA